MAEKKKERRMTLVVPAGIATDITALAKALGLQQQVVKKWVAEAAFGHIDAMTVRTIIKSKIGEQLELLDPSGREETWVEKEKARASKDG